MALNADHIYKAFDPSRLDGPLQQDLYVDLSAVRGDIDAGGVTTQIDKRISTSSGQTCQFITGYMGSGKSTELQRLKSKLADSGHRNGRIFPVFLGMDDDLNPNDVDLPDLLLAIVRQTASDLRGQLNIELKPNYFMDRITEFKETLLTDVKLEGLTWDMQLAKLAFTMKSSETPRHMVRKALEPRVGSLIQAVNDIFDQAREQLRKKGLSGLAILVDNGDKLVRRDVSPAETFPGEHLFLGRSTELQALDAHFVYTIPLALAHSIKTRELVSRYGCDIQTVPLTKVWDISGKPYPDGVAKFKEIVEKRCHSADTRPEDLFKPGVLEEIIRLSAGQPRELCVFIRDAALRNMPITQTTVEHGKRQAQLPFGYWMQRAHWEIVKQVRSGLQPISDDQNARTLGELIDSRVILHYRNGDNWMAVSPLVGEVPAGV